MSERTQGLPEGWRHESIGKLVVRTKQRSPLAQPNERFTYIDVSAISNTSFRITEPTELLGSEAPSRARKLVHEDDILFATVRPTLKRVALVPSRFHDQIASTGYAVLRANREKVVPAFLYYQLLTDSFIARMGELQRGASYPAVRDTDILNETIPIPPLPEQQKIAAVLGVVQRAMEQQERLLALTAELKETLLHQLFTHGLRHEPQKQTDIGPVPESWEVVKLESVTDAFDYGTSVKCDYEKPGFPVLRIPNVIGGSIDISEIKHGQPKRHEIGGLQLRRGDLLFVRTNGVLANAGRCALYREEIPGCYFASYLIRVRVNANRLDPAFLNEYARTGRGVTYLSGKAIRTADGKFNINTGTLRSVLLPLPPIEEQQEIVAQLGCVERKLSLHQRKHATLTALFRTLLHELMTAQIRVEGRGLEKILGRAVPEMTAA